MNNKLLIVAGGFVGVIGFIIVVFFLWIYTSYTPYTYEHTSLAEYTLDAFQKTYSFFSVAFVVVGLISGFSTLLGPKWENKFYRTMAGLAIAFIFGGIAGVILPIIMGLLFNP